MLHGKRIVVVMPAYNAAETLKATYNEIPLSYVDAIVLVDDASTDETVAIARGMGIETIVHPQNRGYGGNQKTCYTRALEENSDDFVFDNQMLCQALYFDFTIGEISCPAKYFAEASSIRLGASTRYGLGVMKTTLQFWLQKRGLARFDIYRRDGGQL